MPVNYGACDETTEQSLKLISLSFFLICIPAVTPLIWPDFAKFWFTGNGVFLGITLLSAAYVLLSCSFAQFWWVDSKTRPAILFLIGYFIYSVFVQARMDFQSWDALSGWFNTANDIITSCTSASKNVICAFPKAVGDNNFQAYVNRHPQFLFWHYAIFSYAGNDGFGTLILLLAINFFILLIFTLIFDSLRKSNLSSMHMLIIIYAAISYPLLENHRLLVGYAEMMMLAVGFFLVMTVRYLQSRWRWWVAATGIFAAGIFCSLKNSSAPILAAMAAVAICVVVMQAITKYRKLKFSSLTLLLCCVSVLFIFGYFLLTSLDGAYQVWVAGSRFGIDASHENLIIMIGGYRLGIEANNVFDVFSAFSHALLYNQSFSVLWILSALLIYELRDVCLSSAVLELLLPMTAMLGYVLFVSLAPHGLSHFAPSADTYGSRYFVFALSLCILCWGSLVLEKNQYRNRRPIPKPSTTRS